jgi:hypothetical protein
MWIFLKNKVLETRLKKQRTSSRRDGFSLFTEMPSKGILGSSGSSEHWEGASNIY